MNCDSGRVSAESRRRIRADAQRRSMRRKLMAALGVGIIVPLRVIAQQKAWRIGFLGVGSASGYVKEVEAIRAELRKLGYIEGKNIAVDFRWAESNPDKLKQLAVDLVAQKPDVIITHAMPGMRAAIQATSTIPIVIADGPDPVAAGLVKSLARPGGNVTGSTAFQAELVAKRLELLQEAVPRIKHVGALFNASNPNMRAYAKELENAAGAKKIELHPIEVKLLDDFPDAFSSFAQKRVDAVIIAEDPLFNSNNTVLAALAKTHKLPAVGISSFAEAGGLLGYSANRPLLYGHSAAFVDKILRGAKPGEIPIERATKFDLIVNAKTAHALNLKLPQLMLQRADKVIE